jgi:enoyl-CoA hydratase
MIEHNLVSPHFRLCLTKDFWSNPFSFICNKLRLGIGCREVAVSGFTMLNRCLLRQVQARKFHRHMTLRVGSVLRMERKFTREDIQAFSQISLDKNPLHFDSKVAVESQFQSPVVHGMLVASMFSALVGNSVPGSIYLTQNLKWLHPVYAGDAIVAEVQVLKLKKFRQSLIASMRTICTNERDILVIDGRAMCTLPQDLE